MGRRCKPHVPSSGTTPASLAWAVLFLAIATFVTWVLRGTCGSNPYLLFYPAIVAAAALGGVWPGLLAAFGAALCIDLLFTPPVGQLGSFRDPVEAAQHVTFLVACAAMSVVAGMRRSAQERERRLAAIIESSGDAVMSQALDGTVVSWNAGAEGLFGYQSAEIIGQPSSMLVPPERMAEEETILRRLREGPRVEHIETVRVAKDGRSIDVSATVSPVRNRRGQMVGISKVIRDIGDRKRAEQGIVEQNRFLNSVLESLTHPFYVIDANNYLIKMANSAARLGKLGPYTTCHELTHRSRVPCHLAGEACPVEQIRATGKPFAVEHIHYDAEGKSRVYEVHGYPVLDESGQVVQIIEYSLDISDRKRTQAALQESRRMLQLVLDTIPVRVFWKNTDSVFLGCNRLCAADAGFSTPEELVGKSDLQMPWREHAGEYVADDKAVIATGVPKLNYEELLTMPDGK